MGKFELEIELGNAEMKDETDIAWALQQLSHRFEGFEGGTYRGGPIKDVNGNKVGTWKYVAPARGDDEN